MPLSNDSLLDQKRKFKKKILYNSNSASGSGVSQAAAMTPTTQQKQQQLIQQSPLFPIRSINPSFNSNSSNLQERYKPRSRTEIYSSNSAVATSLPFSSISNKKNLIQNSAAVNNYTVNSRINQPSLTTPTSIKAEEIKKEIKISSVNNKENEDLLKNNINKKSSGSISDLNMISSNVNDNNTNGIKNHITRQRKLSFYIKSY
jgi:hypothetical protein